MINDCGLRGAADSTAPLTAASLREFSKGVPNSLLTGFEKRGSSVLYSLPPPLIDFTLPSFPSMFSRMFNTRGFSWYENGLKAEPPKEAPFETNLTEALVGWKAWSYDTESGLTSASQSTKWTSEEALTATCTAGCTDVPREHHTCGIYAGDTREEAEGYADCDDDFVGLVYGWGRYVRGGRGWRAQYAYPKAFYLKRGQINFIDGLRAFRVPIYIEQPTRIYNPEEDGYESRGDEADWYLRASEKSDAEED